MRYAYPIACLLLSLAALILADAARSAVTAGDPATAVITDESGKAVRVLIDGRTVLTVDATGIRVNGDVAYSGVSRDTPSP